MFMEYRDMKYQAVVFDFDYTLGDSTEGILSSVRYGMERLGRGPMERESVRRTIGLSLQETYRALTGDSSGEQAEKFAAYFREQADKVMVGHTELFPDTMELLQALKGRGMRAGIVTTKYHYRIDAILEKCHAAEYIDLIVGGEDVSAPKPDPEGLFLVLETWGLPREQVLYVGDSAVDAKTADAAGVDFAGVTTGTAAKEELEKYPCIGVYRELSALKKALMI
jgi:phosphoglycolate phosphatase